MLLAGLQKLTLLDFPGHMACTVFTHGCNLRCPFCHNAGLVVRPNDNIISEETFFEFLGKRKGLLDGVAITGGEPLLQMDIADFMRRVRAEGFKVKLDTNGFYPEALERIVSEGLADYVAMDIKSSPEGYAKVTGIADADFSAVKRSAEFLMRSGIGFEFRTTAVKGLHTLDDFKKIGEWIAGDEKYFIQHFTDSGDLIGSGKGFEGFGESESLEILRTVLPYLPNASLRG